MALEPVALSAAEQPNEELTSMTRRFWLAAACTAPFLLFMFLPQSRAVRIAEPLLAIPVFLAGAPIFSVPGLQ